MPPRNSQTGTLDPVGNLTSGLFIVLWCIGLGVMYE